MLPTINAPKISGRRLMSFKARCPISLWKWQPPSPSWSPSSWKTDLVPLPLSFCRWRLVVSPLAASLVDHLWPINSLLVHCQMQTFRRDIGKNLVVMALARIWLGLILLTMLVQNSQAWSLSKTSFDMNTDGPYVTIEPAIVESQQTLCMAGSLWHKLVRIQNHSQKNLFSGQGVAPQNIGAFVNASYRLYDHNHLLVDEGRRWSLGRPLGPDQEVYLAMLGPCPTQTGVYSLVIDIVQEGIAWGHSLNPQPKGAPFRLEAFPDDLNGLGQAYQKVIPGQLRQILPDHPVAVMNQAAQAILSLQRFWYHEAGVFYQLIHAGSQYPMVWVRDMATAERGLSTFALPSAGYDHHWAELFLRRLNSDGIIDWFAASPELNQETIQDKNTILPDQELWLIRSILDDLEHKRLDPHWLVTSLPEQPQVTMATLMHLSLKSLMTKRWHSQQGCLMSGHTADWGDVGLEGFSLDSTKMQGPRVCSLYSQSLLFDVITTLKRYEVTVGFFDQDWLKEWGGLAQIESQIRLFVDNKLWQPKLGYFRVHFHIDPIHHAFDEDAIFALGGHVLALEAGLVTRKDPTYYGILDLFERRPRQFHLPFGTVLIPCYPSGFFQNPGMDEPYEYQNGGIWDWYAPRAARLIASQSPVHARMLLEDIAVRVRQSQGFYEWYQLDQTPGAGRHYAASAASFLQATNGIIQNDEGARTRF